MFITLEGPDGAGKTTQINLLASIAKNENYLLTRNPGGTEFGLKLREILLNDNSVSPSAIAELMLYMSDRAQHIETVIKPALAKNQIVICDRFIDSTVVYQGYARGLNIDFIKGLNDFVCQGLKPDLTFLLDIDANIGFGRLKSKDKIEAEGLDFQKKVRAGFLELASQEPNRFEIIDTNALNELQVHEKIKNKIMTYAKTLSFQQLTRKTFPKCEQSL